MDSGIKIVHVNPAGDPAGVSWLLHCALREMGYESHHIMNKNHVFGVTQGSDIFGDVKLEQARIALNRADVLHFNNTLRGDIKNFTDKGHWNYNIDKYLHKPMVFHNHGGSMLLSPYDQIKFIKKQNKNFIYIACSPLTKAIIHDSKWLPNIVPLQDELYMPPLRKSYNGTLTSCQKIFSTSVKPWKGTDVLIDTVERLKAWFKYDMDFQLISDIPVRKCLKLTQRKHICIDNITQGFVGMCGWEGLAQGQVVIARLDPIVMREYNKFGNGKCPIMNVSGMDELAWMLRKFYHDRKFLKKKSIESREWMEEHYKPERIVNMYLKVYKEAIKKNGG